MDKEIVEDFYKKIEIKREERDKMEKQAKIIDRQIEIDIKEYRIGSTIRILEYINNKLWKKEKIQDLQNLIVHCLNKLNGNIDGIELTLKEED